MHDSDVIDHYVRWLETLTKSGVHRISMWAAKDVRHRTPLAEGAGHEAVAAVFETMFDGAASVKTKIIDRASSPERQTVYLRWDRLVTTPKGQIQGMSGVSEIMLGMDGKIASITDHWDSLPQQSSGWLRFFKK